MISPQDLADDMPLSDDPLENLKLENELLALRLRAEAGSYAELDTNATVNPADELRIQQQIHHFRTTLLEKKTALLYDILGRPAFIPVSQMNEDEIPAELEKLQALLVKHSFEIASTENFIPTVKYRFITELLFKLEVNDFQMPGLITQFVYEEFQAEFEEQMRSIANDFMYYWSRQILKGNNLQMADVVGNPFKPRIPQSELYTQLQYFFDAYPHFHNLMFNIEYADFDWGGGTGGGPVVGQVEYGAEAENGEITLMKGQYSLFMYNHSGHMCITHFDLPGFKC